MKSDPNEEREMVAEYDQAKESIEVREIKQSQEAIHEVLWWKKRLGITGWVMYAIAAFIWIVQDNDRGVILLLMAFAVLIFNATVLQWKLSKRRMITQNLLNSFMRKKAVPFYQELCEKFADQPHLHIHLSEDGTIQITDRSQRGIK